jgi:hypothetical protein
MFEDKATVEKTSLENDRPDGSTLHLNLLDDGSHRNAIVVYRQFHERPGILHFPKPPSASMLTQRISHQKTRYAFVALARLCFAAYFW